MILWIIAICLVVLLLFVLKVQHVRHRVSWIVLVILGIFIYITFVAISLDKSFDLTSVSGFKEASLFYFSWLVNAFKNIRTLTGNAISMDWGIDFDAIKPDFLR
jgi:ACR3 family arsenite efflux pump ArsB